MQSFEHVAVIAKPDGNIACYVQELVKIIERSGCTPHLDENALAHMPNPGRYHSGPVSELARDCEAAIAIGGDGTMLGAARMVAPYGIPVIGINAGRLGFITDIVIEDMHRLVPSMLSGHYVVDKRSLLEGEVYRNGEKLFQEHGVNDIGISHGRALGMVEYTVYVDGQQMAVQHADGVIVSTATGSTAYAMAAGGPIMHPQCKNMLMVPVAPHTLSNRPIVLSSRSIIDIELNETRSAVASFDAQVLFDVAAGDVLRIYVSPYTFTMLHPVGYNHFDLLRRKLKWNYLPKAERPIHTPVHKQTAPAVIRAPVPLAARTDPPPRG